MFSASFTQVSISLIMDVHSTLEFFTINRAVNNNHILYDFSSLCRDDRVSLMSASLAPDILLISSLFSSVAFILQIIDVPVRISGFSALGGIVRERASISFCNLKLSSLNVCKMVDCESTSLMRSLFICCCVKSSSFVWSSLSITDVNLPFISSMLTLISLESFSRVTRLCSISLQSSQFHPPGYFA